MFYGLECHSAAACFQIYFKVIAINVQLLIFLYLVTSQKIFCAVAFLRACGVDYNMRLRFLSCVRSSRSAAFAIFIRYHRAI